jgi:hypothetical protein
MMNQQQIEELESGLAQACGSEEMHKYSRLFYKTMLTDGAMYLAEKAGAYWLMDVLASWQTLAKVRNEPFQVWTMTVNKKHEARVVCDDGNGNKLAVQIIPYTDFPLETIKLYLCDQGDYHIVMLPQEY